jgi:hypothetical protein
MALECLLQLDRLGIDTFLGKNTAAATYWPRVFGGQLVAQALAAADRTVSTRSFSCHSLHSAWPAGRGTCTAEAHTDAPPPPPPPPPPPSVVLLQAIS